jgi:hypothetical protein
MLCGDELEFFGFDQCRVLGLGPAGSQVAQCAAARPPALARVARPRVRVRSAVRVSVGSRLALVSATRDFFLVRAEIGSRDSSCGSCRAQRLRRASATFRASSPRAGRWPAAGHSCPSASRLTPRLDRRAPPATRASMRQTESQKPARAAARSEDARQGRGVPRSRFPLSSLSRLRSSDGANPRDHGSTPHAARMAHSYL